MMSTIPLKILNPEHITHKDQRERERENSRGLRLQKETPISNNIR